MKTLTVPMQAHVAQGATTLTSCWKITRTDGQVFHYTELDQDIVFEGETYKSAAGFNKSAITSSATFAVDKLEVTGFLRDDGITDEEIRNGAFDYAQVEVFMVNFEDLSMGKIRLRAGWFGEVRTTTSGAFLVELRGLVDQLQVKIGTTYLPECQVDLGSKKCGIKLIPDVRKGGTSYKVDDRIVWPVTESAYVPDRHYPEAVDQNISTKWDPNRKVKGDIDVKPFDDADGTRPWILRISNQTLTGSERREQAVTLEDVGVTQDMIDSGLYKITFRARYFRLSGASNGFIRVHSQERYFNTNIFNDIETENKAIRALPPKRKWVEAEVSMNIHPDTDRFAVSVGASKDPQERSLSVMYFDELDVFISLRDDQPLNFASYGGIEFRCTTAGKTSSVPPEFTGTPGDTIVDGSVTWVASVPKYTHLRALTADMTSTTVAFVDPAPATWEGFYDWGVLKFLTGENAGRAMEIQDYNSTTGRVKLALPLPYRGVEGDLVLIQAGCGKTVKSCQLFENILNYRGHPRVPGQGQYFKIAGS